MNGQNNAEESNEIHSQKFAICNESVKIIAETVGIANLDEAALNVISDKTTFVLKLILEESKKFLEKNNRIKLTVDDMDFAMRNRGIEPIFGFYTTEPIPFRMASGGAGRDIYFEDEKEIDLNEIINSPLPKIPIECTIKPHWLAIEGNQPLIPENPAPIANAKKSIEQGPLNIIGSQKAAESVLSKSKVKLNAIEKVQIKEVTTHELSIEQQLYLKEITEACVGSDENRRIEALNSLMTDTGLFQMLPRLCNFIAEGVRINTVQNNLALLIYLMRMTKSLVDNQSLSLEKYLHELIPPMFSCIISRQLCIRPDIDNHWALRDFAARLICQVCKNFSTSTNQLQSRITKMLSTTLQNESAPLATHYGAIVCLGELGQEVVKAFVLPHLIQISEKLASVLENSLGMLIISNIDRTAAEHIKTAVLKIVPPVIRQLRNAPDNLEEYRQDYGPYLGPLLHVTVTKLRQMQQSTSGNSTNLFSSPTLLSRGSTLSIGTPRPTQINLPSQLIRTPGIRNPLSFTNNAFLSPSIGTSVPGPTQQKVLVITSQPRLPSAPSIPGTITLSSTPTTQVVRLISANQQVPSPKCQTVSNLNDL